LVLFIGPFVATGAFMWCLSISQLVDWYKAQSWVEVPARIWSAELRIEMGDEAPGYFVDAEYEYVYQGRRFIGTRVALQPGGDSIGTFHHDVAAELKEYARAGKPFRCFVNPKNPAEAVLYRTVRAEVIHFYVLFVLAFGGIGWAFANHVATQAVRAKHRARLQRRFPQQPWRWLPEWSEEGIPSSAGKMARTSLMWTIFVVGATAPSIIASAVDDRPDAHVWHRLGWIHRGLVVAAMVATVVLFARRAKYGRSRLFLDGGLAVPGEVVSGLITVARHARSLVRVVEHFYCQQEGKTFVSGDETEAPPKVILWERSCVLEGPGLLDATNRGVLPVRFRLPESVNETQMTDEGLAVIRWFLDVKGKADGLDYFEKFEVPVFRVLTAKTSDSDPEEKKLASESDVSQSDQTLLASGVIVERFPPDTVAFTRSRKNALTAAVATTFFFLPVFAGGGIALHWVGAPVAFPIIFCVVATVAVLAAWSHWLDKQRIELNEQELFIIRRFIGPERLRRIALSDVATVEINQIGYSGRHALFELLLKSTSGERTVLLQPLKGRQAAEIIAGEIRRRVEAACSRARDGAEARGTSPTDERSAWRKSST